MNLELISMMKEKTPFATYSIIRIQFTEVVKAINLQDF